MYYIHGYLSDPCSEKGKILKEQLGVIPLRYRDGRPEDIVIQNCLNNIYKALKDDNDITLIGSSLGGFLAAKTALKKENITQLILLNPAIIPPDFNISQIRDMPQRILSDMIDSELFNKRIKSNIFILRGTKDDVVPSKWVYSFAEAQEATVRFLHDDHRFSKNIEKLPVIIEEVVRTQKKGLNRN